MPLAAALCFLAGLVVGPFVGIIVDRAVERESPEAHLRCQHCGQSLGAGSLVPLRSWFARCPNGHRSQRYPIVDITTAVTFAVMGWVFGFSWQLWPYLGFGLLLVAMSVIDFETKLLVDILTFPTLGAMLFAVLALSAPNDFAEGIAPALWAGGLYGLFFLIVYRVYPAGMGFGDVKLAPSLGLAVGWLYDDSFIAVNRMLYAVVIGLLLGGVVGILAKRSRKAEVPFGPFMALGTLLLIATSAPAGI